MKKGRHRRFEEARALKRSQEVDLEDLFDSMNEDEEGEHKPEHDAWADLAEEWEQKSASDEDAVAGEAETSAAAHGDEEE